MKNEEIDLSEAFVVGCLIEKLPNSWKDYKNSMKHKRKHLSLEDVIVHICIEEENKIRDRVEKAKEFSSKTNVVKSNTSWPKNKRNRQFNKSNNHNKFKDKIPSFKKKGNCFVCGKFGPHAAQCRHRHKLGDENPPKANLVHGDEIIAAVVVSQVNMVAEQ